MCSGGGPATVSGHLRGFQMWVGLPAQLKLAETREQFLLPNELFEAGHMRLFP